MSLSNAPSQSFVGGPPLGVALFSCPLPPSDHPCRRPASAKGPPQPRGEARNQTRGLERHMADEQEPETEPEEKPEGGEGESIRDGHG